MPIRPENRWLYPIDWEQLSQSIRFSRAGGRCERCARPHLQRVPHLGFHDHAMQALPVLPRAAVCSAHYLRVPLHAASH